LLGPSAPPGAGGPPPAARRRLSSVVGIALLYAVACFSKETGFFLLGLLVAAELTVVAACLPPERRALRARTRELRALYAACAVVAIAYLVMRRSVLGGVGDDPSLVISMLSHKARLLTMLGVVPEWARLLLWPARLSADYSPPGIPVVLGFTRALIPAMFVVVGFAILIAVTRTGRGVACFGLLWVAVALFPVSNVFVRSGVILAERTLFLPSVGVLLAAGAAAVWARDRLARLAPRRRWLAAAPVVLLLALGTAKSAARQRVWRTPDDFQRSLVEDAPRSYRAHYMHGMWLFKHGRREEGERHVRMAIALFPYDASPYTDLADEYRAAGLCGPARDLYRRAIRLRTMRDRARLGLVACLLHDGQFAEAGAEARRGAAASEPEADQFRRLLAIADSAAAAARPVRQSGAARRTAVRGKDPRP
jgi:protein O-mannosyl-transferase